MNWENDLELKRKVPCNYWAKFTNPNSRSYEYLGPPSYLVQVSRKLRTAESQILSK